MDYDEILEQEHEDILNYCEEIFKKDLTRHYNGKMVNCPTETDS